jgi:GAF domain-containing protein
VELKAGTDEMTTAYELAAALAGQVGLAEAGNAVAKYLRRLVPSAICVFYLYDRSTDKLDARHVVGDGGAAIRGLRIGLGQRLSGWVAANRQTIMNSDAALDLGDIVKSVSPRLRTCLSTSLVFHDELIGVLTLYSTEQVVFGDEHRFAIDGVAPQIAQIVKCASDFERDHDRLDAGQNLAQLQQFVAAKAT